MFKFNFNQSNEEEAHDTDACSSAPDGVCSWLPAREHSVPSDRLSDPGLLSCVDTADLTCGTQLSWLSAERLLERLAPDAVPPVLAEAARSNSDLLTGRYEGGLKVWECTWDLVRLLSDSVSVDGLRVAELGCGAALPSIWTLKHGATSILVQDYNPEVLDLLTLPNLQLNCDSDQLTRCTAFSGDWGALAELWRGRRDVDLVLTSETIYNASSCARLLDAIDSLLASDGACLVAAKTCYFGVGGGTRLFEQLVREHSAFFCQTVFSTEHGLQREVIKLQRK